MVLRLVGLLVFGRRVCPTDTACLLPDVGPLLEVQPIQQYNFKPANHTLESYHVFKFPGPTTVKKYTPICVFK